MRRLLAVGVTAGILIAACSNDPYENKSELKSVRILAAKADIPFARPGETVNLEALIQDGRERPTLPMRFFWFPAPCTNPAGANYFNCFPSLEAAYPDIGVDISSRLVEGTRTSITIPSDALSGVVTPAGATGEPRVTSWQFMMICAGHVERKVRTTAYQENQSPFGCFGDDGRELPVEQGSFAFMRVTVTQNERNAHPKIATLVLRGNNVDPAVGISVPHCDRGALESSCDTIGMDVTFAESDAELDPANLDANGNPGRETIYSDWFITLGRFPEPRRIQRDPFKGRPEASENLYEPPRDPGRGILWVVLHDNRGGTDWTSVPVEIR